MAWSATSMEAASSPARAAGLRNGTSPCHVAAQAAITGSSVEQTTEWGPRGSRTPPRGPHGPPAPRAGIPATKRRFLPANAAAASPGRHEEEDRQGRELHARTILLVRPERRAGSRKPALLYPAWLRLTGRSSRRSDRSSRPITHCDDRPRGAPRHPGVAGCRATERPPAAAPLGVLPSRDAPATRLLARQHCPMLPAGTGSEE